MKHPRCKQRGINRNIYNRSKGRGNKPLSASGGFIRHISGGHVRRRIKEFLPPKTLISAVLGK